MSPIDYLKNFMNAYGPMIISSENYKDALKELRDCLFKAEHRVSRYHRTYDLQMKRPPHDILYVNAEAVGDCPAKYRTLWTLPNQVKPIPFTPDDDMALDIQVQACILDCHIWANIIHTNDTSIHANQRTEQFMLWLLALYIGLNCQKTILRKNKNTMESWSAGITYDQLIERYYRYTYKNLFNRIEYVTSIQNVKERNLINYKDVHKKNDGDPYVFKSRKGDHSNSATCLAKYTDEQRLVIMDTGLSIRAAAARLKELGRTVSPSTVSRVRKRLYLARNKRKETALLEEQTPSSGALF